MASTCILVLLDGLGDRSYKELDDRTPLQAASTPNLDYLASIGCNGLFHAQQIGMALPSENAHFAIFGYPQEQFPGRGYLEALGADAPVKKHDVALLAHFVNLTEKTGALYLQKQRPEAEPEEIEQLISAISTYSHEGTDAIFWPTKRVDGLVLLKGNVSPQITDTDPIDEGEFLIDVVPYQSCDDSIKAAHTADVLKSYLIWCYRTLSAHPVNKKRIKKGLLPLNGIVTQRAGMHKNIKPFFERWGLRGLSIASGLVYRGLADFLGLDSEHVKDSNDPGDDLAERIRLALDVQGKYEFVHVHTKAPDAAAHTKNVHNKVAAIESLDQGLEPIMGCLGDPETLFIITADHSTPSSGPLVHSGEPVPILFAGKGLRRDKVACFDEVSCAQGALGFLTGKNCIPMILNCLDRAKLTGLMDTPDDQPYWPGQRAPFRIK